MRLAGSAEFFFVSAAGAALEDHEGVAEDAEGKGLVRDVGVEPGVDLGRKERRQALWVRDSAASQSASAEAVQRPTMRFVPLKDASQLDLQSIHRVRQHLVGCRTALINQLRAVLLERGTRVPQR